MSTVEPFPTALLVFGVSAMVVKNARHAFVASVLPAVVEEKRF
jgi:hypothetical protein